VGEETRGGPHSPGRSGFRRLRLRWLVDCCPSPICKRERDFALAKSPTRSRRTKKGPSGQVMTGPVWDGFLQHEVRRESLLSLVPWRYGTVWVRYGRYVSSPPGGGVGSMATCMPEAIHRRSPCFHCQTPPADDVWALLPWWLADRQPVTRRPSGVRTGSSPLTIVTHEIAEIAGVDMASRKSAGTTFSASCTLPRVGRNRPHMVRFWTKKKHFSGRLALQLVTTAAARCAAGSHLSPAPPSTPAAGPPATGNLNGTSAVYLLLLHCSDAAGSLQWLSILRCNKQSLMFWRGGLMSNCRCLRQPPCQLLIPAGESVPTWGKRGIHLQLMKDMRTVDIRKQQVRPVGDR